MSESRAPPRQYDHELMRIYGTDDGILIESETTVTNNPSTDATFSSATKRAAAGRLSVNAVASFAGITAEILLGGDQAPMTVMSMTITPGQGAPAHISFSEDKVFVIIDGRLAFLVNEDRFTASAGEHIFVARGVTHSFSALDGIPARMTLVATPARHDRFFLAMSDLPMPHNPDAVQRVCAQFDQAITGPVVTIPGSLQDR